MLTFNRKMNEKNFRNIADSVLMELNLRIYPFEKQSKKYRLDRSKRDILYFCRTYLPHHFEYHSPKFHKEILHSLNNEDNISLVPREFGTTTFLLGYILHQILFKKRHNIVYVEKNITKATDFTGMVFLELLYNDRILEDFGMLVKSSIENNLRCVVFSNNVKLQAVCSLNIHEHWKYAADLIILDSIEEPKAKTWVQKIYSTKLYKHGNMLIIGFIGEEKGFMLEMWNNHHETPFCYMTKKVYKALVDGESTWPEKYTKERLNSTKQLMGIIAFNKEMLNIRKAGISGPNSLEGAIKMR